MVVGGTQKRKHGTVLGNAWMEGEAVGSTVRRGSRRGDAAKTQKVKWDSREELGESIPAG